jgi:hypothetical protein
MFRMRRARVTCVVIRRIQRGMWGIRSARERGFSAAEEQQQEEDVDKM